MGDGAEVVGQGAGEAGARQLQCGCERSGWGDPQGGLSLWPSCSPSAFTWRMGTAGLPECVLGSPSFLSASFAARLLPALCPASSSFLAHTGRLAHTGCLYMFVKQVNVTAVCTVTAEDTPLVSLSPRPCLPGPACD